MRDQLLHWTGDFGREYTDRNQVDPGSRVSGFGEMLHGLNVRNVLEVGCNRGHNLEALEALGLDATGVEPGDYARSIARSKGLGVYEGTIYDLPYIDRSFDLVLTSGVLIHVPPDGLLVALAELARVADRYVMCVEYQADVEEEVLYRGEDGLLWRRDYRGLLDGLHGFTVIRSGAAPAGFDDAWYGIAERSG